MSHTNTSLDRFLGEFRAREARSRNGRASPWLEPRRQEALDRFAARGYPTTGEEEWRFTSVLPIARQAFRRAAEPAPAPAPEGLAPFRLEAPEAPAELVFLNGRLAPALSRLPELPGGARLASLACALEDDSGRVKTEWVEPFLGRIARADGNSFTDLNLALFEDGAFLYVPRRVVLEAPLHLVFVSAGEGEPWHAQPRNLYVLGEASQATVIETYLGLGDGVSFTGTVSEAVVGQGGVLDHLKLGMESERAFHVGRFEAELGRDARLRSFSLATGGALVRNDLNVRQAGPGIDVSLDGLYVLGARQHVDNHTFIDHAAPRGVSRQLYKGILEDDSSGVFNGKVLVRAGAAGTDARQTNRNLLLSTGARIHTKPQLEILTDDVKCSHGAAIGQLDADALYYLRSRGLGETQARSVLTWAFASEIIQRVQVKPLASRLHDLLVGRLPEAEALKEMP